MKFRKKEWWYIGVIIVTAVLSIAIYRLIAIALDGWLDTITVKNQVLFYITLTVFSILMLFILGVNVKKFIKKKVSL